MMQMKKGPCGIAILRIPLSLLYGIGVIFGLRPGVAGWRRTRENQSGRRTTHNHRLHSVCSSAVATV